METATRYLATIEALMIENSRLTKELQDAIQGKLPSRIIPQEVADQCFAKIAGIIGPVARGSIVDEIDVLCNEFVKIGREYVAALDQVKQHKSQQAAIEKVVKGDDLDESYVPTALVQNVSRLRAVLEVIKTRLDRLAVDGSSEIVDLRKDVACYLNGGKNE